MDRLIPEKESLTVKFISGRRELFDEPLVDSAVALANTEGGDLYVGVEDDGRITGCAESHIDPSRIAAFIASRTIPPVAVRVEPTEEQMSVIRIHVPKSRGIVASSGGKLLRRLRRMDGMPENVSMYPNEIRTRLGELPLLDYSAQPAPNAAYDDLDSAERERLRHVVRKYNGEKALLDLRDEELDRALQLAVTVDGRPVPTVAGMLLVGKGEKLRRCLPVAETGYQAYEGAKLCVNESFYLPIIAAIEKILAFVAAHDPVRKMEAEPLPVSIPDFNKRAVREAVVNAFVHRDYTRWGRVLVKLDDDGLSVSNPGGFADGITVENLLLADPLGRNPALEEALKRIGLSERSGRGVERIFEGSLLYGRPLPDYSQSTAANVKLFIPRSTPDESFARLVREEWNRSGTPLPLNFLRILNVLRRGRRLSARSIAKETHIPEATVNAAAERMTENGLLETAKNGRGRVYFLNAGAYKDEMTSVSRGDVDKLRSQEQILQLLRNQQSITRGDVVRLLSVTPPRAYRILQKMARKGVVMQEGTTRDARYLRAPEKSRDLEE